MTYARRVDTTQSAIFDTLRRLGVVVRDLSRAGGGCPDAVVSWGGTTWMVECKAPDTWRGRQYTRAQVAWSIGWQGEILTFRTPEDALVWGLKITERATR